jgi:hypothetical protein
MDPCVGEADRTPSPCVGEADRTPGAAILDPLLGVRLVNMRRYLESRHR